MVAMEALTTTRRSTVAPSLGIAIFVVFTLQSMRVFFTLVVNYYGGRVGLVNAAPVVLGVFLAPFLLALLEPVARSRALLDVTLLGLVALRVGTQFMTSSGPRLVVSAAATVLGLLALPLLLAHVRAVEPADDARAAYRFVTGAVWGLVGDVSIHSLFLTWDVAWRSGARPAVVAVGQAAVAAALWWVLRRDPPGPAREPSFGAGLGTAVIGPFLACHVMMLHNVGFAASHRLSIPVATALVLAGDAAAIAALHVVASRGIARTAAAGLLVCTLVVAVALPPNTGTVGMVAYVAAHALAAVALYLGTAGRPNAEHRAGSWRTAITIGLGAIGFVVPPIAYFYGQREPLPFVPVVLFDITIALLALGYLPALSRHRAGPVRTFDLRHQLAPLPLIPLLVGLVVFTSGAGVSTATTTDGTVRLVDYNVSYGVNRDGQVDPEGIARVIESQKPDVVALQEVTRGWLIAGSTDLYEWLGHRLGMPYTVFAPAADRQFGNAVLSRFPIVEATTAHLPIGSESQRRSYLRVVVDLGPERLTVYDVHLSAWSDAATRLAQVDTILATWRSQPRTIVAGDMNASPGEPDMERMLAAGFRSAQDQAGDPAANTSTDPDERIDWVYGTADLDFRDFSTVASRASDHLALATTVVLRRAT